MYCRMSERSRNISHGLRIPTTDFLEPEQNLCFLILLVSFSGMVSQDEFFVGPKSQNSKFCMSAVGFHNFSSF
jgi:hypothetical protein